MDSRRALVQVVRPTIPMAVIAWMPPPKIEETDIPAFAELATDHFVARLLKSGFNSSTDGLEKRLDTTGLARCICSSDCASHSTPLPLMANLSTAPEPRLPQHFGGILANLRIVREQD